MTQFLFSQPNINCFLIEKISQDPLEMFLGDSETVKEGQYLKTPNMSEFCQNTQALRVTNSVCWNVVRGNEASEESHLNANKHA